MLFLTIDFPARRACLGLCAVCILFAALLCSSPALAQTITLAPTSLPPGTLGLSYNQTVTATDGDSDDVSGPLDSDDTYTYAVTVGSLPPGLTLNIYTGNIFGTPSSGGTYNFTITATNTSSTPASGSQAYTIVIGTKTLTMSPPTLPNGTVGAPYDQGVTASGGSGTYNYFVSSGALPAGLTLNPNTGTITGVPTASGPASFTIEAVDSSTGNFASQAYNVTIGTNSLVLNPTSLPNGTQGTPYNQTVVASGGTAPYTYAVTAGILPAGLSLNPSTGVISGTPTATGASGFTIQATDSLGNTGSRPYSVNIGGNLITISPASLPPGTTGIPYNQTLSASGGSGPYTFSISAGSLPAGLSLNPSTGAITGTPTASGPANFTVQATDGNGDIGSRAYTLQIGSNSLTVNPASLPNGMQGSPYSQTVTAIGGTGPYTFSVIAGALPAGLSLNSNSGAITGIPSAGGPANFTIEAQDQTGNFGTRVYNVNIGTNSLTLNPTSLPNGTQGTPYNQTVVASGGTGPYVYSVTAGTLPAGLSLNPNTGAITGTPTGSGASGFTITVEDSLDDTGSRAYSVNIGTNSLTISPLSLPAGTKGVAYNQTLAASGGSAPYTFSITSGSLPPGLALNPATGAISGTPTAGGSSSFTVRVTDTNGNAGSRFYTLPIGTNSLIINPASLPAAVQGTPYSQTVVANGGTAPYTYAIIAGMLPPGLTFNSATGLISGIPTGLGSFSITIQATDSMGDIGSRAYVAFQVRPNPASDPDVQGLIASQAATARRFASTQMTNVTGHLEDLHDAFDPCLVNIGFGASVYTQPGTAGPTPGAVNPAPPSGSLPPTCAGRSNLQIPLAIWAGGTMQFGSAGLNGPTNQFTTGGLTVGADGRLANSLIVGIAAGYGTDRAVIGTDGTMSTAQNFNAMAYTSYQPIDGWFFDGVIGYGTLSFDSRRFESFDGSLLTGNRAGADWFGSLTVSTDLKNGAWKISPYVRGEMMAATLQGYAEQGGSLALTYGGVTFRSTSAVLGLRGSYDIPLAWGVLSPMARLEYRHELDGGFNQPMFYSDLGPGQTYVLNEVDAAVNSITGAVGVRARASQNLSAEFEYRATVGDNASWLQAIRVALRLSF